LPRRPKNPGVVRWRTVMVRASAIQAGLNRRSVLTGLAAGSVLAASGCATTTNPVTGRQQMILIDDAQLSQAALQAWDQQVRQTPTWNNRAAQVRLERVGARIVNAAGL